MAKPRIAMNLFISFPPPVLPPAISGSAAGDNDISSTLELIKADWEVCQTNFFAPDLLAPPVIHAANGMVCIENGVILRPFDPKFRSRNQIPIDCVQGASCVSFKSDLLEPVLSADDIDLLQRYCGLILIGENRAQKILMMIGGGGTSKGTITRLITLIIKRANVVQLRVDQLKGRFETVRVVGKLLLNVVEATANYFNHGRQCRRGCRCRRTDWQASL